jgi:hypothetical protein
VGRDLVGGVVRPLSESEQAYLAELDAAPMLPERDGAEREMAFAIWVGLNVEAFAADWTAA